MTSANNRPAPPSSTQEIARRGEAIYAQKRDDLERSSKGKFVAINILTSDMTVADTGEQAVERALTKDPQGLFHLVRIGHQSAFEAGWYMTYAR
jgi:hypothetical protein